MQLLLTKLQTDEMFFLQFVLWFLLFCVVLANIIQTFMLRRKLNKAVHKQDGMTIEAVIHQYYGDIEKSLANQAELKQKQLEIEELLTHCITKVGVVRFNPFGEVGGNQSFAIALLDQENTGIVLSSLYGRESSRFYGKPVVKGKSSYQLSAEEEQAIEKAKKGEMIEA